MSREDITDPRVVPRWVEAGVSGVARAAEWDVSLVVECPELAGAPDAEIRFAVLEDGTILSGEGGGAAPMPARLVEQLAEQLAPPFEATALRQGAREWFLGARRANLLPLALPESLGANEITVAVGPDGGRTVLVDGEDESADAEPALLEAATAVEALGRARHDAFVAHATRAGHAWKLTIDPL